MMQNQSQFSPARPAARRTLPETPSCDKADARRAARSALIASRRLSRDSTLLDERRERAVPRLHRRELTLGKLLGSGGYSDVYEVSRLTIATPKRSPEVEERMRRDGDMRHQLRARRFLADHCIRENTGEARYAVKFLKRKVMAKRSKFELGAADLVVETRLLSSLDHPNIVKVRGVVAGGVSNFANGLLGGYFILLDRMTETLSGRLEKWKAEEMSLRALPDPDYVREMKTHELFMERLRVSLDIAGALKYLHGKNLILRDLKPDNIGFDTYGTAKLFDFGFATELKPQEALHDGTYKLSCQAGTLQYMAPEVALSEPYNSKADVYSFGTMLWEMLTLRDEYGDLTVREFFDRVIKKGKRPAVPETWPFLLQSLVRRSWSSDLHYRPSAHDIHAVLRRVISGLRGGDESGLEKARRRSTHRALFNSGTQQRRLSVSQFLQPPQQREPR